MATIIDNTYFTNELTLPVDNINIQLYIDEHEPIILKTILGYALYKEFTDALSSSPAQKWVDLRDGKEYTDNQGNTQKYEGIKSIIADYVFFEIVSDKQWITTDGGVKIANTENSEFGNPRYKQRFANTDMVNRIVYLNEFINSVNDLVADTYDNYLPTTIIKGNIFNI